MPRKPDVQLEKRILDAAFRLWSEGGEHGLTMRGVATAAKTTTPTLYEKFRDKDELLAKLKGRVKQDFFEAVAPSRSIAETCERGLDYIRHHGNEYKLLMSDWGERWSRKNGMPSYEFVVRQLAAELGGAPEDYGRLAMALISQVHGTGMLLVAAGVDKETARELREVCLRSCEALVKCQRKG